MGRGVPPHNWRGPVLINSSKLTTSLQCWRKAFNSHVRALKGEAGWGLVDGTTFHAAVAHGMATGDWEAAELEARVAFNKEKAGKLLLPGEERLEEEHWRIVKRMVQCYKETYGAEDYQIIMPEARFAVDLPGTLHNDPFVHWQEWDESQAMWVDKWNHSRLVDFSLPIEPDCQDESGRRTHLYWRGVKLPFKQDVMNEELYWRGLVKSPHEYFLSNYLLPRNERKSFDAQDCLCSLPHQLRGITDAIVLWKGTVWLHEHKTTSWMSNSFWDEYKLDVQPTIYLYGIWKSTKLRPRGFIINALIKPSEKQIANWQSKRKYGTVKDAAEYISFQREAFTRTEEDLTRIESQLIENCDEWVRRWLSRSWPMSNVKGICTMYNRLCDYHGLCMSHDAPEEIEAFRDAMREQRERRKEALANDPI